MGAGVVPAEFGLGVDIGSKPAIEVRPGGWLIQCSRPGRGSSLRLLFCGQCSFGIPIDGRGRRSRPAVPVGTSFGDDDQLRLARGFRFGARRSAGAGGVSLRGLGTDWAAGKNTRESSLRQIRPRSCNCVARQASAARRADPQISNNTAARSTRRNAAAIRPSAAVCGARAAIMSASDLLYLDPRAHGGHRQFLTRFGSEYKTAWILRSTPPGYRTSGGVGWLAGARFT